MAFYDDMKKALSKTKDEVVQKTGNYTEMAKLNSSISELKREIQSLYEQLGELCYQKYTEAPERMDADILPLYQRISDQSRKKEEYYLELLKRKGLRRCEVCGKEISAEAAFCNYCGSKQQIPETNPETGGQVCPQCGEPYEESQMFCMNCGFRLGPLPMDEDGAAGGDWAEDASGRE